METQECPEARARLEPLEPKEPKEHQDWQEPLAVQENLDDKERLEPEEQRDYQVPWASQEALENMEPQAQSETLVLMAPKGSREREDQEVWEESQENWAVMEKMAPLVSRVIKALLELKGPWATRGSQGAKEPSVLQEPGEQKDLQVEPAGVVTVEPRVQEEMMAEMGQQDH